MSSESLSTAILPRRSLECGRCGAPFECGGGTADDGACWCASLSLPPHDLLLEGLADCLCPDCLAEVASLLGAGKGAAHGDV